MTETLTVQTPLQPIALAAALERSRCLPLINGPRSLILTMTVRPLCVTLSFVPNGKVLWAAVKALGLNFCPLAVILLLLHSPGFAQSYQDATIVLADAGTVNKSRLAAMIVSSFIRFPFVGAHDRIRTCIDLNGHFQLPLSWFVAKGDTCAVDCNKPLKDSMKRFKVEHQLIKIKSRYFNGADVSPIIHKKRNEVFPVYALGGDGYLLSIRRMQRN